MTASFSESWWTVSRYISFQLLVMCFLSETFLAVSFKTLLKTYGHFGCGLLMDTLKAVGTFVSESNVSCVRLSLCWGAGCWAPRQRSCAGAVLQWWLCPHRYQCFIQYHSFCLQGFFLLYWPRASVSTEPSTQKLCRRCRWVKCFSSRCSLGPQLCCGRWCPLPLRSPLWISFGKLVFLAGLI